MYNKSYTVTISIISIFDIAAFIAILLFNPTMGYWGLFAIFWLMGFVEIFLRDLISIKTVGMITIGNLITALLAYALLSVI